MQAGRVMGLLLFASAAAACGESDTLTFVRDGDEIATFTFEVASTAEDRERGLRGRNTLATGEALLISFPRSTEACIVNSGVTFAIDAVFVTSESVVRAVELAIPADDDEVRCQPATLSVLEVGAGQASLIRLGDELRR